MYPGLRKTVLPKFDNISVGGTGIATLTRGRGYHVLHLDVSDANGALIDTILTSVEVLVNGDPQRVAMAPSMINAINSSRDSDMAQVTTGTPGVAGYKTSLPIYFAEPDRKSPGAVTAGVLHNNGVDSVEVKVVVAAGASTPVVDLWAEWEPSSTPLGSLAKWSLATPPLSADVMELVNLHLSHQGDLIQSLHFFPTSDGKYVETLRVKVDGEEVRETLSKFRNQVALLGRGLQPDTSGAPRYDYVLDYDDPILRALLNKDLKSFEVKATLNAAPTSNMKLVTVHVGKPNGGN